MSVLNIKDVTKVFATGNVRAVDTFSLDVADGELVCLLGPSGSGKSTLLRMVGGFERPSSGLITIDGEDITHLPPEKRPTGMVFQSHALWTHMNVFKNLAFGLKLRRLPADEIKRKVEAVLELVGLGGYGNRHVSQLSGGQQQRVALARSLVLEPKILLLDEPFASLDQHLRERLREEVRDIQQRLKITTLFVTHGQGFIGTMNLIQGEVQNGQFHHAGFTLPLPVADGPAILAMRPEALDLEASEPGQAKVHRVTDFGTHGLVDLDLPDGLRIKAMVSHPDLFKPGQGANLKPKAIAAYRDNVLLYQS